MIVMALSLVAMGTVFVLRRRRALG